VLLAAGRQPNTDGIGLDEAGVETGERDFVETDASFETTADGVYAIGDVNGPPMFTHSARDDADLLYRHLGKDETISTADRAVPWAVFTDPQIGHVGLTEAQGRERFGNRIEVCNWPMERVDRALCEGETSGFIKIVHQPNGAILGVTIVNGRAGEMIHEWTVAMDQGMKLGELVNSIHIYPTYSMASQQAALHVRVGELLTGASGRIIRALARLML
jgi:pyruvate/2-oxoglutarate dehydrogenase complex dihydrolipoamide dehydrogenase (E3) component